ncbi:MAG TPA: RagB/SusD family nutrient uptake outer membrane protein [Sphingobacteriaceae bacterium]
MKLHKHTGFLCSLAASLVFLAPACELNETVDPNNPSVEGVLNNASVPVLNTIVTGTESGMRLNLEFYLDDVGAVGRELYRFSTADPRYTGDLLGKGNAILDNNTFYITNPWNALYRVVKNTNILIEAVNNTAQPTEEQKQGYLGFANTIKAYALLLALNLTNENGIRIDVADPDNIGPIVDKTTALTAIAALLDEGSAQLGNAGTSFPFQLSAGFTGFDTPESFRRFNRGLASRVALYREDFAGALASVQESFLVLGGNYSVTKDLGVYHIYSNAGGDEINRFFLPVNSTGEVRGAHSSFVTDAEAAGEGNDLRIAEKVAARSIPSTLDNLTVVYGISMYDSNLDPVPLMRNEELMLIYAEASIQTGALQQGLDVLNQIRTGNNLAAYAGPVTREALLDEMLKQRRYSLFMEGHRWIDMRRYGRLDQLPLDRTGDDVWESFPIPFAENEG